MAASSTITTTKFFITNPSSSGDGPLRVEEKIGNSHAAESAGRGQLQLRIVTQPRDPSAPIRDNSRRFVPSPQRAYARQGISVSVHPGAELRAPPPAHSNGTTPMTAEILLSAAEVAKILSVTKRQVWKMAAARQIPPPIKVGSLTRWRLSEIESCIANAPAK
jgi:predicted DNA-binding transcriptional regulator AlpA